MTTYYYLVLVSVTASAARGAICPVARRGQYFNLARSASMLSRRTPLTSFLSGMTSTVVGATLAAGRAKTNADFFDGKSQYITSNPKYYGAAPKTVSFWGWTQRRLQGKDVHLHMPYFQVLRNGLEFVLRLAQQQARGAINSDTGQSGMDTHCHYLRWHQFLCVPERKTLHLCCGQLSHARRECTGTSCSVEGTSRAREKLRGWSDRQHCLLQQSAIGRRDFGTV